MDRKQELFIMLEEEKDDPFLYYALALEYLKDLNYQEALKNFQQTIALDNHYIAAYYQLGIIFRELDITDVAKDYLIKGKAIAQEQKNNKSASEFQQLIDEIDDL